MISADQIAQYRQDGFAVVPGVLPADQLELARKVVDEFVELSAAVDRSDDVFDLEPGHTAAEPRLRRLKEPTRRHPVFRDIAVSEAILDSIAPLIGPNIRFHASKLNMKSAEFGSPVEWHQDLAFYPHTNDDLLAVGVALDDCDLENGCLLVIPGSHRGPILDHNSGGRFVGAVDPGDPGLKPESAVPVILQAGDISIHHARTLHASAPNTSTRPRRLVLYQYGAADAFPIVAEYNSYADAAFLCRGDEPGNARLEKGSAWLRGPSPEGSASSIYDYQAAGRERSTFGR